MTELAISSQGLEKIYPQVRALNGLDLNVPRGAVYGFLGRNGAGKTTTIKTLLGLVRPSGGAAQVLGLDIRKDHLAILDEPASFPRPRSFLTRFRRGSSSALTAATSPSGPTLWRNATPGFSKSPWTGLSASSRSATAPRCVTCWRSVRALTCCSSTILPQGLIR